MLERASGVAGLTWISPPGPQMKNLWEPGAEPEPARQADIAYHLPPEQRGGLQGGRHEQGDPVYCREGCAMSWTIDFPWVAQLENTAVRMAADLMCDDSEGLVGWWRQRLQEQGHELEQVERLAAQHRAAAWRSGPTSSTGRASGLD